MIEDKIEYKNPLGRQLFSLYLSGVYVTTEDLVEIGKNLGKTYPHKGREALMEEIYKDLEKEGEMEPFIDGLIALYQQRIGEYAALLASYPAAGDVVDRWIHGAQRTVERLQAEKGSAA